MSSFIQIQGPASGIITWLVTAVFLFAGIKPLIALIVGLLEKLYHFFIQQNKLEL